MANRRMIVQIIPNVILRLPSTISSAPIDTSFTPGNFIEGSMENVFLRIIDIYSDVIARFISVVNAQIYLELTVTKLRIPHC